MSRRAAASYLLETYAVGQRRACELLEIARSSFRYRSQQRDDELRQLLVALAWHSIRLKLYRLGNNIYTADVDYIYQAFRSAFGIMGDNANDIGTGAHDLPTA